MKYLLPLAFSIFYTTIALSQVTQNCATNVQNGQNITINGDFSDGNTGFTYSTPGYSYFTCPNPMPSTSCYSGPGKIWVGDHSDWFNQGFNMGSSGFGNPITDHTPTSDNNFLMVDGQCSGTPDAWIQTYSAASGLIQPNTWYYFECYVTNINNSPTTVANANLAFIINGTQVSTFNPPTVQGQWVMQTATWFSGAATSATIRIRNVTSVGCSNGVDFGLDDITFTPGCSFSDNSTNQPNLGSAGSLCGTGGAGITLDAGTPSSYLYTWKNSAGTVLSSTGPTLNVNTPDTYVVCVQNGSGSCMKSDVITVTATVPLTSQDYTLCSSSSATLDAGWSGVNVTYQWFKSTDNGTTYTPINGASGTGKTYIANSPGWYYVEVKEAVPPSAPTCASTNSPVFKVTSNNPATPNNINFCPPGRPTFSINGAPGSTYEWYNDAAATTPVSPATIGTSYTPPTNIGSGGTTSGTQFIYYAKDITNYTETNIGASVLPATGNSQTTLSQYHTAFTANQTFTIDSVTVYWWLNNANLNTPLRIQFQLGGPIVGGGTTPSPIGSPGPLFSTTNSGAQALGIISPAFPTPGQTIYAVRVPVNITVPSSGNYTLTATTATTGNVQIQRAGMTYPYTDPAGVLAITGTAVGGNNPGSFYGGMYNWRITYPLNCQAVPVIATADCVLPVDFINFNVSKTSNSVYLNWQTGSEINSSYFSIMKSYDGINFEEIGIVAAAGNSSSILSYLFVDDNPGDGNIYYRIEEHDIDGSVTLSPIKVVSLISDNLSVTPNPAEDSFILSGSAELESTVCIHISNALGQEVFQTNFVNRGTTFSREIDIGGFAPGIYILQVKTGEKIQVKKIIKE